MFRNYFSIAIRTLLKNKLYSLINISGLSVGIAVSILILIFVAHEMSFDRFHVNGDKIVRAEKIFTRDGRHSLYANPEFAPALKEIDAHILNYVRTYSPGRKVVKSDQDHRFLEERFIFADTSYFSIFSFPLVKGERSSLSRPNTVIVSEKIAEKYFGKTDVLGKELVYDKNHVLEIVGVAKNYPSNSSIQFDFIGSFSTLLFMPQERNMIINNSSGFPTYLLLSDKNDIGSVNQSIVKTNYTNSAITYSLAPLFDNHFNLNFGDTANTRYVFIFLSAALLILSLALINYMNLTTARASARAKEVGIRKVIGAQRKALAMQFFIESAITTAISFLFAIVLIQIFKPAFFSALQLNIDSNFLTSPTFIVSVVALLIFCVFVSGSYPALVLPSFKPVEVLKGNVNVAGRRGGWLRKALTVFQFGVSIGLIICTLVMSHQLNYLRTKETGLARQQVLVVPIDPQWANSHSVIKHEVGQESGVVGVAIGSIPLYRADMSGVSLVSSPVTNEQVGTKWIIVDKDFFDVLGVTWMQKPGTAQLIGNHIFNETAVQAFGLLDKQLDIDLSMGDNNTGVMQGKLVGVVEDFNFQSLRNKIEPLIITVIADKAMHGPDNSTLYIRIDKDTRAGEKIASIKKIYEKYSGDTPFSYYFLDDAFNELQNGEERLGRIFAAFTSVALMIASLGMLGLITFTVERRTKEISIRKVLGASLATILSLLSSELIILVLIGVFIGSPIAWLVMRDWLNNFYYQADFPSTVIFLSSAAVLILAGAIVCLYGIRAALDNPAKNLMSE